MTESRNEFLVDALPYIDEGYDEPGVREAVLRMIDDETKRYKPVKNYLDHLPPLELENFETEVIKNEMKRIANMQPMAPLNMKRYELPGPPSGRMSDLTSWQESVDNSYAQLEHQAVRIANLELMNTYGAEAWKTYNTCLNEMLTRANRELHELRKQIQEINWQRKSSQTNAGEKLKTLETNWVGLVSKNFDIERALVNLETDIYNLRFRIDQIEKQQDQESSSQSAPQQPQASSS